MNIHVLLLKENIGGGVLQNSLAVLSYCTISFHLLCETQQFCSCVYCPKEHSVDPKEDMCEKAQQGAIFVGGKLHQCRHPP